MGETSREGTGVGSDEKSVEGCGGRGGGRGEGHGEKRAVSSGPGLTAAGRFAPSTTGHPHPGTLLAALLCWLDARSLGARLTLRLEDLDPQRCRPEFADALREGLEWMGLDWDEVVLQSDGLAAHEAALDRLAEAGLLYPCSCSRSRLRESGRRAPDGSAHYPGLCRGRSLPAAAAGGWRASGEALRVRLPEGRVELCDEGGGDLSEDVAEAFGDPVVRRRDGAIAYHLASVVDDAQSRVTRIVRGRDLATTSSTQVLLQRLLGLPTPCYRHHLLLLEERGDKLAKFHQSLALDELRPHYSPAELCGLLAHAAGLRERPTPATPAELLPEFSWQRVGSRDRPLRWTGSRLELL